MADKSNSPTTPSGKGSTSPAGKAGPMHQAGAPEHGLPPQLEQEMHAKNASDLKAAQAKAAAPVGVKHTVASGETLSHISDKYYKTPNRWREIYEANKDVIGDNPGMIKAGQVLVIPNA